MLKEWKIAKSLPTNILKEHQDISPIILQLLSNREIFKISDSLKIRQEKIEDFLNPSYENLLDPFLMKDLKKAVLRIKEAIKDKEKIAIFGDYDADGVTSTVLLYEVLKFLGANPITYIPHRDKEGYGLNKEAVTKIAKKKVTLIITVDCGIRNLLEIKEAKKQGMDVIVTDHHEVPQEKLEAPNSKLQIKDILPPAYAVINPKRKDCKYPFKKLAGVGVAFKLAQGLLKGNKEGEIFLKWLLDLVAIGTAGDVVPLISENRIFAKFGFLVFKKTRRLGIIALKKSMGEKANSNLSFYLAPRLNSAGRMDHANWAFMLLETKSQIEALKLARKIEELNKLRQELTDKIIKEAREEIKYLPSSQKIIILAKEGWPASVLGIVAGRLAEDYQKPVLIAEKKGKFIRGSGRSFNNFDLNKALEKINNLFLKVGGHKQAVGFTYEEKNHKAIVSNLEKEAERSIKQVFKIGLLVDAELNPQELNLSFYRSLEAFTPFGEANPEPLFLMRETKILESRRVGLNNHLKLRLEKEGLKFSAIAFRKGEWGNEFQGGKLIDFIFKLRENSYLGMSALELEVLDLRHSKRKAKVFSK